MFATRKFRDEVGFIAAGISSASFSVSTQISSTTVIDASKFRKLVFALYANGTQYGNKTLTLQSISTSASSISSASSNWTSITSCSVVMNSSLASVSSQPYAAVLEVRGEAFQSANSFSARWFRAVVTCTSGVSSDSVDRVNLAIYGVDPQYGPASQSEPVTTFVTSEVDFL